MLLVSVATIAQRIDIPLFPEPDTLYADTLHGKLGFEYLVYTDTVRGLAMVLDTIWLSRMDVNGAVYPELTNRVLYPELTTRVIPAICVIRRGFYEFYFDTPPYHRIKPEDVLLFKDRHQ